MGLLDDAIREHLDLKRRRGADPAEVERAEHEALGPVRRNPGPGEALAADDLTDAGGAYDDAPGGYAEAPAHYDEAPAGYDDAPGYDEPAAGYESSPTAFDEPPVGREAPAAYDAPGEGDWAEEPAASVEAPADSDLGAEPPRGHGRPAPVEPADLAEAESWSPSDADPAGLEPFPTAPPAAPRGTSGAPSGGRGPHSVDDDVPDDATVEYRIEEPPVDEEGEDMLEETPEFLQDTPDHDRLWFEQRPPRDFDFDG